MSRVVALVQEVSSLHSLKMQNTYEALSDLNENVSST